MFASVRFTKCVHLVILYWNWMVRITLRLYRARSQLPDNLKNFKALRTNCTENLSKSVKLTVVPFKSVTWTWWQRQSSCFSMQHTALRLKLSLVIGIKWLNIELKWLEIELVRTQKNEILYFGLCVSESMAMRFSPAHGTWDRTIENLLYYCLSRTEELHENAAGMLLNWIILNEGCTGDGKKR